LASDGLLPPIVRVHGLRAHPVNTFLRERGREGRKKEDIKKRRRPLYSFEVRTNCKIHTFD
jgi:hypothetical protein